VSGEWLVVSFSLKVGGRKVRKLFEHDLWIGWIYRIMLNRLKSFNRVFGFSPVVNQQRCHVDNDYYADWHISKVGISFY